MGRYDALTELEEKQPLEAVDVPLPQHSPASMIQETPAKAPPASPFSNHTPPPSPSQAGKKQRMPAKNPEIQQPSKSVNALQSKLEKFDKYSTYLRPGYKKLLKTIANDRDCKSYEVLDEALTAFFEARKK